ncbi:MAG: hypothetical protein Q9186_001165 [Xanthomendoza sp. 1 TL-2023]
MLIRCILHWFLTTSYLVHAAPPKPGPEGERQLDEDVCASYIACANKGKQYWSALKDKVSQATPTDRADTTNTFEAHYGVEFASLETPVKGIKQDLIDHGFEYEYTEAMACYGKDPVSGVEDEETAYMNMFYTYKGLLIAESNYRPHDSQNKLPWSELMYHTWTFARAYADESKKYDMPAGHPGGGPISNLNTVIQYRVINDQSKNVIRATFLTAGYPDNEGDPTWRRFTETETPEWFLALLGTDNVKGTVWLLRDHAAEIGKKVVSEIWIRWKGVDPDIWIMIAAPPAVAPGVATS